MKGMIKKSAFIVSRKLRLNMGKLGVYNGTNVPVAANNFLSVINLIAMLILFGKSIFQASKLIFNLLQNTAVQ